MRDPSLFVPSHVSIWENRKFKRLVQRLVQHELMVHGALHSLWGSCMLQCADGNLEKWDVVDLARAARWPFDAEKFIEALILEEWIDRDPETGTLSVHDWELYGGEGASIRAKKREAKRRAREAKKEAAQAKKEAENRLKDQDVAATTLQDKDVPTKPVPVHVPIEPLQVKDVSTKTDFVAEIVATKPALSPDVSTKTDFVAQLSPLSRVELSRSEIEKSGGDSNTARETRDAQNPEAALSRPPEPGERPLSPMFFPEPATADDVLDFVWRLDETLLARWTKMAPDFTREEFAHLVEEALVYAKRDWRTRKDYVWPDPFILKFESQFLHNAKLKKLALAKAEQELATAAVRNGTALHNATKAGAAPEGPVSPEEARRRERIAAVRAKGLPPRGPSPTENPEGFGQWLALCARACGDAEAPTWAPKHNEPEDIRARVAGAVAREWAGVGPEPPEVPIAKPEPAREASAPIGNLAAGVLGHMRAATTAVRGGRHDPVELMKTLTAELAETEDPEKRLSLASLIARATKRAQQQESA